LIIKITVSAILLALNVFFLHVVGAGIAFTAYLDHNMDLGPEQTIKFNRVKISIFILILLNFKTTYAMDDT